MDEKLSKIIAAQVQEAKKTTITFEQYLERLSYAMGEWMNEYIDARLEVLLVKREEAP